jgi:hypothetical protein
MMKIAAESAKPRLQHNDTELFMGTILLRTPYLWPEINETARLNRAFEGAEQY